MWMSNEEKEQFAKNNFGLVHSCANRFKGRGIEYDDLFSTGCMGLVKAIDAFDEDRGVKFSTYAVPVILGEIKRLFRDGGAVKVSRGLKELSMKLSRVREEFNHLHGREPTITELSELVGVSPEDTAEAISAGLPPISLTPVDDDHNGQIDIETDSIDERLADTISLQDAVERLDDDDRKLIMLRYFEYKTQNETAKKLGMTQVQVSRKEKKILSELKAILL